MCVSHHITFETIVVKWRRARYRGGQQVSKSRPLGRLLHLGNQAILLSMEKMLNSSEKAGATIDPDENMGKERISTTSKTTEDFEQTWVDKVFHFPTGEITITVEAKEIDNERRQNLFEDIREFRNSKPKPIFSGRDGSIFLLSRSRCCLKELVADGKQLIQEHTKLNSLIQKNESFPRDIKICPIYGLVRPPLKQKFFGQKTNFLSRTEEDPAILSLKGSIDTYIIMPFIDEGVNLADLVYYSYRRKKDTKVERVIDVLLQRGVLNNRKELASFFSSQIQRIEESLLRLRTNDSSQQSVLAKIRNLIRPLKATRDFAGHNIVIDSKSDPITYYLIDL